MEIQEVALSSFVAIEASWPADESHQLTSELKPTHLIVHRAEEDRDYYYLFRTNSVLQRLEAGHSSVLQALDLHEQQSIPLIRTSEDAEAAPDRCIVHDDGRIIGFFDVDYLPPTESMRSALRCTRLTSGESAGRDPGLVTRYLQAELPRKVEINVSVSLLVSISAEADGVGTETRPFVLPPGTTIDIILQPRRGFAIEGPAEISLEIATQETLPIQFKVRGTALGPGELRVLAFNRGQPLSVVTLRPVVLATGARLAEAGSYSGPLAPVSVRVPDLMLLIEERDVGGKPGFMLRLHAPYLDRPHNLKPFGPVILQTDALGYFNEFFKDIEALRLDSSENRAIAEEQLKAKGASLFERVFPTELQKVLWDLRDRNFVLQVQSEEPWIPWELCRLCGEVDGDVDGPFLCEAFAVARWQPGVPPKSQLQLTNMALVVPADSCLPLASVEREAVLALADDKRKVSAIPANFLDVQRALRSGAYDGWHFTGHGAHLTSDPNKANIFLEKKQIFTPDNLAGEIRRLGRAKPLVFLNACQTGRGGMSLTGIGGWAREFLASGAGAFIGTYWSVYDRSACDFAQALYAQLLSGEPMGKAVQVARAAIRNSGDPTWLAYTVFADPMATLAASMQD